MGSSKGCSRGKVRLVSSDAPCLVAGEAVRRRPSRLLLEIDVGERLTIVSRTMKQASVSSADQGGGRRRAKGMERG